MAAQLPYLPPIDRFQRDTQAISKGTAEDVAAQTSIAGKTGAVVRGGLAVVPAAVRAVNDTLAIPNRVVVNTTGNVAGNFGRAVLGLPALSAPQAGAPGTPSAPVAPQPQSPQLQPMAPVKAGVVAPMTTDTAQVPIGAATAAPLSATTPRLNLAYDPVAVGLRMQEHYAQGQRDAVLAAAEQAAATGNPLNATARYMAALHALPSISGQNNFGATEGSYAGERLGINERERNSELTSATEQYKADTLASTARDVEASRATSAANTAKVQASALRHNVQVVKIGEHPNPDPATRVFMPAIPEYGTVTTDENGKTTVANMDGTPRAAAAGAPAVPTVGAKVKQADGSYPLFDGRKVTVKNGAITKIE